MIVATGLADRLTGKQNQTHIIPKCSKFSKISACSLDKKIFLKEIMKVSHVPYHVLNSSFNLMLDKLTEDKLSVPTSYSTD